MKIFQKFAYIRQTSTNRLNNGRFDLHCRSVPPIPSVASAGGFLFVKEKSGWQPLSKDQGPYTVEMLFQEQDAVTAAFNDLVDFPT